MSGERERAIIQGEGGRYDVNMSIRADGGRWLNCNEVIVLYSTESSQSCSPVTSHLHTEALLMNLSPDAH